MTLTGNPQQTSGTQDGHRPVRGEDLDGLLDVLAERASRPPEEARALPAALYTSQALYELEIERIWRRSWIHVGRVEELANAGDYIKKDIAGEPIVVTRGRDGEIRALSRVCKHRFMDILEGADKKGCAESFACPYHQWTYSSDGTLQSASFMGESALFQREKDAIALTRFRVETWQGFVFVNLDPDAAPLSHTMDPVAANLGNYNLGQWRLVDRIEWGEVQANWKLVVDNGREAYHHIGTHLESLQPMWPAHMVDFEPLETSDFFLARMFISPEAADGQEDGHYLSPAILPPAPGLTAFERSHTVVAGIYPGFILVPGPDVTLTLSFVPTGLKSHYLEIDLHAHQSALDDPDLAEKVAEVREWITQVNGEDAAAQVAVQNMLTSSRLEADGGPLSHLEQAVRTFQRYLAKRLVSR